MHPEIPTTTVSDLPDPLPEGTTVLDVREPTEWEHGHIEGATHLPVMQLLERLEEVPEGRLLVVCRVGSRSARVTAYLTQQGYDAVNLAGGLVDWVDSGRPLVSETGRPPHVA